MNTTTYQKHLDRAVTRSFTGLMALYESSYQRLEQLVPEMDFPFDEAISRSERDADLYLVVLDRAKYTTDIHLTYWFSEDGEDGEMVGADPDLVIRVYRDAGVAEALRCGCRRHALAVRGLDPGGRHFVNMRWGRNLLLNKWLAFCLAHGHGFATAHRPRVPETGDGVVIC